MDTMKKGMKNTTSITETAGNVPAKKKIIRRIVFEEEEKKV